MSNLDNPNQLDDFVKHTLNNYNVEYNHEHWNEFEKKLNTHKVANSVKRFSFSLNSLLWIAGFTSAAFVGLYLLNRTPETDSNTLPESFNNTAVTSPLPENPGATASKAEENVITNTTTEKDIYNQPTTMHSSDLNASNKRSTNASTLNPMIRRSYQSIYKYQNRPMVFDKDKNNGGSQMIFPDQIDPHRGLIYNTMEEGDIRERAKKEFNPKKLVDVDDKGKKVTVKDSTTKQFFEAPVE